MGQGTWTDLDAVRSTLTDTGQTPPGLRPGGLPLLPVPAGLPQEQILCLDAEERRRMAAFHREADRFRTYSPAWP